MIMLGRFAKITAALGGLAGYNWDNCDIDFFDEIKKGQNIPYNFTLKYSEKHAWDTYSDDTNIWSYFSTIW